MHKVMVKEDLLLPYLLLKILHQVILKSIQKPPVSVLSLKQSKLLSLQSHRSVTTTSKETVFLQERTSVIGQASHWSWMLITSMHMQSISILTIWLIWITKGELNKIMKTLRPRPVRSISSTSASQLVFQRKNNSLLLTMFPSSTDAWTPQNQVRFQFQMSTRFSSNWITITLPSMEVPRAMLNLKALKTSRRSSARRKISLSNTWLSSVRSRREPNAAPLL